MKSDFVLFLKRSTVCHCSLYRWEREVLFSNILKFHPGFSEMTDENKFVFLLGNTDREIFTWVGKFTYKSFKTSAIIRVVTLLPRQIDGC